MEMNKVPIHIPGPDEALTDDEYARIIRADLDGNEAATEFLRQNLGEWVQGLQLMVQDVQAQLSRRKAEDAAYSQECRQLGEDGKRLWFAHAAQSRQWRSSANGFLKHLQARLREVKTMLREQNVTDNASSESYYGVLLQDIIARLERIETMLDDGE